jgi:hypothetical protein
MKGQFAHYLQQWRKETFHSFDVPKKKETKWWHGRMLRWDRWIKQKMLRWKTCLGGHLACWEKSLSGGLLFRDKRLWDNLIKCVFIGDRELVKNQVN